jgi:hypothetical protein
LPITKGADMGYFDALTSSWFKKVPDGRKLFFPYGTLGRGYIIDSQQTYERLHRQVKVFTIVVMVLIIGAGALQWYVVSFIIAALCIGFYMLWTRFLVRGLQQSDEKLSLEESMTSQAVTHSAVFLWLAEIITLAFVGLGILILVVTPDMWITAFASIIFFGMCAAVIGRMLVLRRRSRPTNA